MEYRKGKRQEQEAGFAASGLLVLAAPRGISKHTSRNGKLGGKNEGKGRLILRP